MSIYNLQGSILQSIYSIQGNALQSAYNLQSVPIYPDSPLLPVPTGDLVSSSIVVLPDIHDNGHGWTCTGLAYDANTDTFLVGDIGKELPSSSGFASQIVRMSHNFQTVVEQIPLYTSFPNMSDVQGITIDTTDGTIWFCSTSENLIRHIQVDGTSISSFSVSGSPTGIAYSPLDDSLWVLTYASSNNIKHMSKTGATLEQYTFNYSDTLDQCFLDPQRGYLYITAGANYSSRNNIYLFDTSTHAQNITCTVDSYSVEGLWIGTSEMIIVNDGYYHSAYDNRNVAVFYTL